MLVALAFMCAQGAAGLESNVPNTGIVLTLVDDDAIGYATFQSHNQKVIENAHGIFMTHLRRRNEAYTAQDWRLSHSVDGGQSFVTVYEATHATNPPVLETDGAGTVYLARPDFEDGNAYLYRFTPENEFRDPVITSIPGGAAGKYAMQIDLARERLYFFAHNNRFFALGLDGTVHTSVQLLRDGPNACLQYPLLAMDMQGVLHAAWTSQKHGVYCYWDIHHMLSLDGGGSWRTMAGAPLELPVIADDTGPATRISLDDEFESHTWLSSFYVKAGKAHFLYLAQSAPPREHYVRYDVASGVREFDSGSEFKGETMSICSLDGFFASRDLSAGSPLYCVSASGGRLVCLASNDNGGTWKDWAKSDWTGNPYSVGGCRSVTQSGYIIGSFTDQESSNTTTDHRSSVYFFRISAAGEG